jgi:signal transduction histidine kinase
MFARWLRLRPSSLGAQILLVVAMSLLLGLILSMALVLCWIWCCSWNGSPGWLKLERWPQPKSGPLLAIVWLGTTATALALTLAYVRRAITQPLDRLQRAGTSPESLDVLSPNVPAEVRRIARVMGQLMRDSATQNRRVSLLAALSHDLRMPLTRLRLRAERSPVEVRDGLLREIESSVRMIELALLCVRSDVEPEMRVPVDLAALLRTVCDEFADVGFDVRYLGPPKLVWRCAQESLSRAIANLIDNANRHARHVRVELREITATLIELDVIDDGPGIPAVIRDRALDASFESSPRAESDGHHGFGLGLSIVRTVVRSHSGELVLLIGNPGASIVRIRLEGSGNA